MTWDGKERRKDDGMNQDDHDLLIRIDQGVSFLRDGFEEHVKKDEVQWGKVEKINLLIAKWTGIGTGAGVILGFILKAVLG